MINSEPGKIIDFRTFSEKLGRFELIEKIFLIPEMVRFGSHLMAASFRSFGIKAIVMETGRGLDLGKEFTSGKECYPCHITLGDILYYLKKEQERLGSEFKPENYVYFMPEAGGPCRFGMYNKYQRIVLDLFPEFRNIKIGSLSTEDGYSLEGIIDKEMSGDLRKVIYYSIVIGDIMDRLLLRVRPYEKESGQTDAFIDKALEDMITMIETYGKNKDFGRILNKLCEIIDIAKSTMDTSIPRKPIVGIVGEIYLRTHTFANQDIIRILEKFGAEVVNASIAEWVNFITYRKYQSAKAEFWFSIRQLRLESCIDNLKKMCNFRGGLLYQEIRQRQAFGKAVSHLDIPLDHKVSHLEKILLEKDLFNFEAGTEACLSIAGILEYIKKGFNGVVNVYPFTCMPSTITSAVIKPVVNRLKIPYLDAAYDSGFQSGREAALRTFMYQADQHFRRNGRNVPGKGLMRQ